jgi:hypothetical protein
MGQWNMSIQGSGFHHNNSETDADLMAAKFVQALKAAGHSIRVATITCGSMEEVVPPEESSLCNPGELVRAYGMAQEKRYP